jgi:putative membrane-bound dehydrogenase-like protein
MKSLRLPPLPILFAVVWGGATHAAQVPFPGHHFTLPDGFTLERIAGPPLVDRPISIALDEQGRLYATDSAGMTDKADKQREAKPHRVVRLEDTDGDGRYDKSTVFADKMMFPEGAMWYEGSLYVAAPPEIWKLTDTNNDGVADQREVWFDGKTLTGCANDLHGPYLGPDGWFYWAKGAFAEQTYTLPNGKPFTTRASHIFRSRPDGSGIEPVMTGGMDNPVDVTWTLGGERILTTTFFQHPGGGLRDGLIHAIYGGVYGKQHDVLNGHPRTGELMPVLTHMGPAAPCGLTTYESRVFGDAFRGNLFACQFNLRKVSRHVLVPDGATFKTVDSDFLVSDSPDFHPTDVIEDADGSLLIVDTGGWYKICCPSSQLWKPDVLGAIYRVRKTGAPTPADPRGLKINWTKSTPAQLAKLLGDERLFVRQRAVHELGKRGEASVKPLQDVLVGADVRRLTSKLRESKRANAEKSEPPDVGSYEVESRRNAVWALSRIEGEAARAAVRTALKDSDPDVVQAAIHAVALWRDAKAVSALQPLLKGGNPQHARAAAEVLGRLGDAAAVPALLAAANKAPDRALEHSLTFALIEIGNAQAVREAAKVGQASSLSPCDDSVGRESGRMPAARSRAALIALDQMPDGGLKPADVLPLLNSKDAALKETAEWIIGHRPEWSAELGGYFREQLTAKSLSAGQREELQGRLARLASDNSMQSLIATMVTDTGIPAPSRQVLLRAMQQASLRTPPAAWGDALKRTLAERDADTLRAAVATVRALPVAKKDPVDFSDDLLRVARNGSQPADLRVGALAAVTGGLKSVDAALFDFLAATVAPQQPPLLRSAAAAVLARARLTDDQLLAIAGLLKTAGPMELATLLGAFDRTKNEQVGLALVESLGAAANLASLRADMVITAVAKHSPAVQQRAETLAKQMDTEAVAQKAKLHDLLANLPPGDIRRGQAVYLSERTACATCHAIGHMGGKIGPDLTRIGQVRTEADLLESIVFPSRTFVRSYEPVLILAKDGESYTGVIKNESADSIHLVIGPTAEQHIPRAQIAEIRPGQLSIMPAGLDQSLSPQEMADLVAFLKSLK